tara:strand:- start:1485 stop:1733 length:249 start_codon:yes stop_codon:yes gene_type:complete
MNLNTLLEITIPAFSASIPFAIFMGVMHSLGNAEADDTETEPPIAMVEIVEEEIEIEYVDPDIWSQWVFDTDSGVEYINLRE